MPAPETVQCLSDAEISKVGRLARLAIPENRLPPSATNSRGVHSDIVRLRRLDLRCVEPMARVGEGANRLDHDAPEPLASSDLMRSVTDTMEPFIEVPKVLGEAEGA